MIRFELVVCNFYYNIHLINFFYLIFQIRRNEYYITYNVRIELSNKFVPLLLINIEECYKNCLENIILIIIFEFFMKWINLVSSWLYIERLYCMKAITLKVFF